MYIQADSSPRRTVNPANNPSVGVSFLWRGNPRNTPSILLKINTRALNMAKPKPHLSKSLLASMRFLQLVDSTVSQFESLVNLKGFPPYRPNDFTLGLGYTVSQSRLLVKPLFIKAWCIS